MAQEKEIELLLRNIQKGLRKYSVKELNDGILAFLYKKHDKSHETDYVLEIVCKEYEISLSSLKSKNVRGNIQEAKQIAYCLLHFNLGLSIRQIASRVFMNWPTSVSLGVKKYKTADSTHAQDKKFIDRYEKLQEQLIKYIREQENLK